MVKLELKRVPFSAEEVEKLKSRPSLKSEKILMELQKWRQSSLNSAITVCCIGEPDHKFPVRAGKL